MAIEYQTGLFEIIDPRQIINLSALAIRLEIVIEDVKPHRCRHEAKQTEKPKAFALV